MATWQFSFYLIPASAVERHFSVVPLTISLEEYDRVDWWNGCDLLERIQGDLATFLSRGRSWHSKLDQWGDEDGDRFDVWREGQGVAETFGRVDVRTLSMPYLNRVIDFARRHQLMLITEDRHVLRPSVKELRPGHSSLDCVRLCVRSGRLSASALEG